MGGITQNCVSAGCVPPIPAYVSGRYETRTPHPRDSGTLHRRRLCQAGIGKPAPDFTLKDASGKEVKLSDYKGKYVVLEWVNFGCPFVKKHYGSGNMQALQKELTGKGAVWLSICSSGEGKQGYFPKDEVAAVVKENGSHATDYLLDTAGTVGKLYDATTTPDMFLINPEGCWSTREPSTTPRAPTRPPSRVQRTT